MARVKVTVSDALLQGANPRSEKPCKAAEAPSAPSSANSSSSIPDQTMDRRDFMNFVLSAPVVGAVSGGVVGAVVDPVSHLAESKENTEYMPGEVVKNFEFLYSRSYAAIAQVDNPKTQTLFYDRFGNIIDSVSAKDIKKSDGSTVQCWDTIEGKRTIRQEWYDAIRKILRKNHSIKDKLFATNAVGMVRGSSFESFVDRVLDNGQKEVLKVSPPINRIEYARKIYSETDTDLPQDVQNQLADICYGKAGVESMFDNSSKSEVEAGGIWQIMTKTLQALGYTEDDLKSYVKSTHASLKQYENIYSELKQYTTTDYHTKETYNPDSLTQVKDIFFDGDEASFNKYFLFPVLVNGYNAGGRGVADVINGFVKEYSNKNSLEKEFGAYPNGYGYDLYWQMSQLAGRHKWYAAYGPKTSKYFFQSLGMAEAIREKMEIEKIVPDEINTAAENVELESDSSRVESAALGAGIGFLAGFAVMYREEISQLLRHNKKIANPDGPRMNRREFLKTAVLPVAVGYGAVATGIGLWGKELFNDPEKIDVTNVFERNLDDLLTHYNFKNFSGNFFAQNGMRKNFTSSGFKAWIQVNSAKFQYVESEEDAKKLPEKIENGNLHYRMSGVAGGKDTNQNIDAFTHVQPETKAAFDLIISKYQQKLKTVGIKDRYIARSIISSLTRMITPKNGSPDSLHRYGFSIDFSRDRFDIVDTKLKKYIEVNKNSPGDHSKIYEIIKSIFLEVLVEIHTSEKNIIVTVEDHPRHIHIGVKKK